MGSFSPIHGIGRRIVGKQKPQLMIDFGKGRIDDFCRHEVGKHFFGPYVVEPFHGDQVTEPHMGCFVGNDTSPS